MELDKQYCIYGLDTSAFYFEEERNVEQKMYKLRDMKKKYKEILKDQSLNNAVRIIIENKYKETSSELARLKETLI